MNGLAGQGFLFTKGALRQEKKTRVLSNTICNANIVVSNWVI